MAKRKKKKKYGSRKNPKRVRAAKRAYKKSGLYKYNLKRKGKRRGKKKYSRKKKAHRKHRKHHARRKAHRKHRKHYKRLPKHEARAARIARKLAKVHARAVVAAANKPKLTAHQKANLARLRAKAEAARAKVPSYWAA